MCEPKDTRTCSTEASSMKAYHNLAVRLYTNDKVSKIRLLCFYSHAHSYIGDLNRRGFQFMADDLPLWTPP